MEKFRKEKQVVLRELREEDIPEGNMALFEYFNDLDDKALSAFPWYVSDDKPGLNWYRFMLSHFNGLNFSFCRYSVFRKLRRRFLAEHRGDKDIEKLADILGVHFTTVYRDLDAIKRKKSNKVN